MQAAELRGDPRESFAFGGVMWERYRGKIGTKALLLTTKHTLFRATFLACLSPGLPCRLYGDGEHLGLPIYSKSEPMKMDRGIELEAQSNPIHLCTRPNAVIADQGLSL